MSDSSLYTRAGELPYRGQMSFRGAYVILVKIGFLSRILCFPWEDQCVNLTSLRGQRMPNYVTGLNGFFACFGLIARFGVGRFPPFSMHYDCKRGSYFLLTQVHHENLRPRFPTPQIEEPQEYYQIQQLYLTDEGCITNSADFTDESQIGEGLFWIQSFT